MIRIPRRATARLLLTLALAATMTALNSAGLVAHSVPALPGVPPDPAADAFYAQPASLAGARMGEIVASRPVQLQGVPARTPLTSWQVKYVSQDTAGTPWTTVATIIKPSGGARSSQLVAFAPWIDALDRRCNPSYQLRAGPMFLAASGMVSEMINLGVLLDRGYTVVVPDYLGPDNHFTASYVEGRNTLDGIRAARNFAPAAVPSTAPVGMFGYSGGARATEFAAELAAQYAPELPLAGTVVIGLPVDISASGRRMNRGLFTGIDVVSALALGRAYPELKMSAMFTDPDLERQVSGMCNAEVLARYAFTDGHDMTVGRRWPLDDPQVARVVATLRAGRLGTPQAPLYLAVGTNDEVALVAENDRLAAEFRNRGVDLTYVQIPAADHITSVVAGAPAAIDWLADRLARAV